MYIILYERSVEHIGIADAHTPIIRLGERECVTNINRGTEVARPLCVELTTEYKAAYCASLCRAISAVLDDPKVGVGISTSASCS